MILGFTGSRKSPKREQVRGLETLLAFLATRGPFEGAHHGVCKGSDEEFHYTIRRIYPDVPIYGHPGSFGSWTSGVKDFNVLYKGKDNLERNRDIVSCCTHLICMPDSFKWRVRSGSWYTAKQAVWALKSLWVVLPNGEIETDPFSLQIPTPLPPR